jgi:hypothetical protein
MGPATMGPFPKIENGGMAHRMKFQKVGLLVMLLALMAGVAKAVWADSDTSVWTEDEDSMIAGTHKTDFIKERTYIGILGISSDIDQFGDFNGTNSMVFQGSTTVNNGVTVTQNPEIDLIPSITRQFGWGVMVGHREGPWAAEVSFVRSDHTASFIFAGPITQTTPASLQAVNIDLKRYFFTEIPTQPFINIGVSFPWLWVRNFSYITDPTGTIILQQNDETISGIGFNLGAGLELYLDNNFSILGGLYQRWAEYDQINGASKIPLNQMYFDGNPSNIGALSGNGLTLYVGTTFGFE